MWESHDPFTWLKDIAENPGKVPNAFAHQDSLPRLPVPDLNETLDKYLEVVRPLVTADELRATREAVEKFRQGQGKVLQQRLLAHEDVCKRSGVTNWLKDWWLYAAYLSDRTPIPINSNVYAISRDHPLACIQKIDPVIRAAAVLNHTAIYQLIKERGLIPIDFQGKRPLCMDQYRRVYSTVRRPGEQIDTLETYPIHKARHVVVLIREHFFHLDIIDENMQARSAAAIQHDLEDIVVRANRMPVAPAISTFTYQNRTFWAQARAKLIAHSAANKVAFESIESCISVTVFDENEPATNDDIARLALNGEGRLRYFDKSSQGLFFANGRMGNNAEHTPFDAPPSAHGNMSFVNAMETAEEYIALSEVRRWELDRELPKDAPMATSTWRYLAIELPPSVQQDLVVAIPRAVALAESSDIKVLEYAKYGNQFIRNVAKQSPDSWVQMALQVAYYRLHGKCVSVYETQTTRLFRDGRTETGRPLSVDQVKWVHTFQDAGATAVQKFEALRAAIAAHVKYMLEAGQGKGIDRHLLGLRMCCQPTEHPGEIFTDPAWAKVNNFLLSTSNMTPGIYWEGGFGAYLHEGYGCCYGLRPHQIWVSIATRTTVSATSSDRFRTALAAVFDDMRTMVRAAVAANPKITEAPNPKAQARL